MRLFVDDFRPMPEDFDVLAKTYQEALQILSTGLVTHINLDYDLGVGESHEWNTTGRDISRTLARKVLGGEIPKPTWAVHSSNTEYNNRMLHFLETMERKSRG